MITHANDAVGHFGLDLLARAPDWLGPAAARAATVPGAHQWRSPTTFVQTLVIREVYALAATDDQLAAAEAALRASELERKRLLDAARARSTLNPGAPQGPRPG